MNFFYYIEDDDSLRKVRSIVLNFIGDSKHVIFNDVEKIPTNLSDGIYIIDKNLEFFQERLKLSSKSTLIVINDILNDFSDYPTEVYISRTKLVISLGAILFDLKNEKEINGNYYSVDIKKIKIGEASPCDLYLNLGKEKFLKCVRAEDIFDQEIRDRYIKKTNFLWVERKDFYLHSNFLFDKDFVEQEVNAPFSLERMDHLSLIYDMAQSCGITDKTIRLVENSMTEIRKNSDKKIAKLLNRFDSLQGTFLFSHSYFLSLFVCELAKKQSWFKHQHIDKLVLAAIVHDLGYKNEENAFYEALPKSKLADLSVDSREDTLAHIDTVLKILKNCKSIDSDVINIIKHHHGGRGEESYPLKSFATEIDLLSGLFLLTHSFTISFFKVSFNIKKLPKVFDYIEAIYNKGNLKKIFPSFKRDILELLGC